jgi:hypothetical protein
MSRAAHEICFKQNTHFMYNSLLTVHSKQLHTAKYEEQDIWAYRRGHIPKIELTDESTAVS